MSIPLPYVLCMLCRRLALCAVHAVQEACHICRGPEGSKAVMITGEEEQDAMWRAVSGVELTQYRHCLTRLGVAPTSVSSQRMVYTKQNHSNEYHSNSSWPQ
jgi:hypothetical protein